MNAALDLERLSVAYAIRGQEKRVLTDVNLSIVAGGAYGLVGESGSGKSTLALAALGILPKAGKITGGRVLVSGMDIGALDGAGLVQLRARSVSMVFQDPSKALNPALTIGRQVVEAYEVLGISGRAARTRALAMLERIRIAAPEQMLTSYPHQLSGGMQQRVLIAIALAKQPALLVLDEPTTGLDATVEADVLDVIASLRREFATAILLISHNLGIVARMCERVGVLYAGRLVEEGPAEALLADPRHPYTAGLLSALPVAGRSKDAGRLETIAGFPPALGAAVTGCVFAPRCPLVQPLCRREPPPKRTFGNRTSFCHYAERVPGLARTPKQQLGAAPAPRNETRPASPVLETGRLSKTYVARGRRVHALADVSIGLARGETLGLVGESGSGKTTLAKILVGLIPPDAGGVLSLDGAPLKARARNRSSAARKALQIIFQNPDSALNRAHTVERLIGNVLRRWGGLRGSARERRMHALLTAVRLETRYLAARPRQLSGGLKQRVAIARAFAGDPRVVICDEPTSALDVSVQAAILNLLADLQREHGTSYLFISHDLSVVRYLADRIAVLYLGHLMEIGPAEAVFRAPNHPYTEALLSAAPAIAAVGSRVRLEGEMPSAARPPRGCVFHTRCPRKIGPICETVEPPERTLGKHMIRCHIPLPELARLQKAGGDARKAAAHRRAAPRSQP